MLIVFCQARSSSCPHPPNKLHPPELRPTCDAVTLSSCSQIRVQCRLKAKMITSVFQLMGFIIQLTRQQYYQKQLYKFCFLVSFNCFMLPANHMFGWVTLCSTLSQRYEIQEERLQTWRHIPYVSLPIIWLLNKLTIKMMNHSPSHITLKTTVFVLLCCSLCPKSWHKLMWELCSQSSIVRSCFYLAIRMGWVGGELIHPTCTRRRRDLCLEPCPIWEKDFCFCFTGVSLWIYLVKWRVKSESGGVVMEKKNGTFANPCSKWFVQLNHTSN